METLLRLGYLVRGVVYGVIGLLALQVVLGGGGALTDTQGAIAFMGGTPLGDILLYAILAGLVGYGLWGLIRAIVDPLHKGTDAKGIAERIGYVISGISYLLLALATYNLITGRASAAHSGAQTAQTQQTVGTILTQPWGAWVVALVALIIIGAGLLQIYQGVQRNFNRQFSSYTLNSNQQKWIVRLGRFGAAARGLVFTLIGFFLFLAAYHNDPSRAQGIEGVLASILRQPYGLWLLGIVALGLIAFGIYSALSGFWLRLKR
jgi:multidrug transporter EmrE-like cation transporter